MTFRLISVKPFNVLDNQIKLEYPKPERDSQEVKGEDIIVTDALPAIP